MKVRCKKCGRYFREICWNCNPPKVVFPVIIKDVLKTGEKVRCIIQDSLGVGVVTGTVDDRIVVQFRHIKPLSFEKSKLTRVKS